MIGIGNPFLWVIKECSLIFIDIIGYTVCELILFSLKLSRTVSLAYEVWGTDNIGVDIFSCHDDDNSVSSSTGGSSASFSAAIKEDSFSGLSAIRCLHSKYE